MAAHSLIVGDVVRKTFALVWQNLFVFFVFATMALAATQIIHAFILGTSPLETPFSSGMKLLSLPIPLKLLNDFLSTFVSVFCEAAIAFCSYTSLVRGSTTLRDGIVAVLRTSWALLCFAIVETVLSSSNILTSVVEKSHPSTATLVLALLLSFAISIIFLIIFLIWSMAVPTIVIERLDMLAALKRSTRLTHHQRSAIFGVGLVFVAVFAALSLPLWAISGVGIPPRVPLNFITPVGFASTLISAALLMFFGASAGVIYVKLREIKDNQ